MWLEQGYAFQPVLPAQQLCARPVISPLHICIVITCVLPSTYPLVDKPFNRSYKCVAFSVRISSASRKPLWSGFPTYWTLHAQRTHRLTATLTLFALWSSAGEQKKAFSSKSRCPRVLIRSCVWREELDLQPSTCQKSWAWMILISAAARRTGRS